MMIFDKIRRNFKIFLVSTITIFVSYIVVDIQFPRVGSSVRTVIGYLNFIITEIFEFLWDLLLSVSNYPKYLLIAGLIFFIGSVFEILLNIGSKVRE